MTCPDISTLQRLLDEGRREPDPALIEVASHVAACSGCAARLGELEDRSRRVRAWLERHDPAVPDIALDSPTGNGMRPLRRWALAASVVLAVGVAAGPARAWIRAVFGGAPPSTPSEVSRSDAATSFHVRDGELRLRFTAVSNDLHLSVTAGADSMAVLESPTAEGEILVAPGSVEVRDPPAAGTYRLTVPPHVRSVTLERPGVPDTTLVVDRDQPVLVPLGSAAR